MKEKRKTNGAVRGMAIIISVVLTFGALGGIVFYVARQTSKEMSASAISNLSESLDLLSGTIEVILEKEAEFQKLVAQEIAGADDPELFVRSYNRNKTVVKMSLIMAGETVGVSNIGDAFSEEELDFSARNTVEDLPLSQSYLNSMGTWAYTMKCPVIRDGREIATLYVEYIYDSFDEALPDSFYNNSATLYIMDAKSERLVLKPKGIGERAAGHLNLQDFYRANNIVGESLQTEIEGDIKTGKNVMFYHDIREKESLIYMWALNHGAIYLIGHVPVASIQREGSLVNQNIMIVVVVMLAAFLICCIIYFGNERQQVKIRKEQEAEREIYNRQLAEALRSAQIANSSKTTFLSNMSHDIRTPMNAILGFTMLLAKDAENPAKVREYTKKITSSGQHLLSLINDVLDVSKIESGKVVLTIGTFPLGDVISSVDAIIRPAAKEKKQTFQVEVTGIRHEYLIGDETRLNQVLINLLSNAVKYTQEGGNIWFRMTGIPRHSDGCERIRIEVEDNGYGMTPEYLEVIFDAFTRAENSTTNKVQGTGLGMAITKNIVELMGGTIEVSSQVNKGSRFTVELELRVAKREADGLFWSKDGGFHMLVVDDDRDMLENVWMLMEDTGVVTDVAYGGEDAVSQVRSVYEKNGSYDVILLDWKMEGMNGIETARQIRAIVPDHVTLLLLTAYDWEKLENEAVLAGINGFLTKPFFVSALQEKLLEIWKKDGQEDETTKGGDMYSLKGKHFLVAEDNEINAEILEELLDIEGASCEIVENGRLAAECFAGAQPGTFDAILMDVQMPVMGGYEATRMIRSMEREDAAVIPVIAMTANAFAEDVKDAMDAGMTAHIAKPIDMELLKKTICSSLQ